MEHTQQQEHHILQAKPASEKSKLNLAKPLSFVIVTALIALAGTLEYRRQETNQQLAQVTQKLSQSYQTPKAQGEEVAAKIVEKVRKIFYIPADIEPTVATIVDVEALRKQNAFYNNAKNGDHLLVTAQRAILYDSKTNQIKDVIPVQIQPSTEGTQGLAEGDVKAAL